MICTCKSCHLCEVRGERPDRRELSIFHIEIELNNRLGERETMILCVNQSQHMGRDDSNDLSPREIHRDSRNMIEQILPLFKSSQSFRASFDARCDFPIRKSHPFVSLYQMCFTILNPSRVIRLSKEKEFSFSFSPRILHFLHPFMQRTQMDERESYLVDNRSLFYYF